MSEFELNLADDGDDIPTPVPSARYPHTILAQSLVDAALTRAEKGRIASGKIVLGVVCADKTAVEHIRGVFSRMAPAKTRALGVNNTHNRWSPYAGAVEETLTVGQGVILVVSDERELHYLVRSLSDRTITIGRPTLAQVASAIKKCHRGRVPQVLDSLSLDDVNFESIAAAIGREGHAAEAVARLSKLSVKSSVSEVVPTSGLPVLADAVEFGSVRDWGLSLAQDVKDYKQGKITWAELDRGAVLVSPPGCGKTTAVQSIAEACGIPLVMRSLADCFAVGKGHLGDVIKQQRSMFEAAKEKAPCILFIDEIDALPNLTDDSRDFWAPVVLDFYLLLDSAIANREGVIVIGATNRGELIQPALLRSGRLERLIEMGPLDAAGAQRVFLHHLNGQAPAGDADRIYELAAGSTAATVMGWARAAKRSARIAQRAVNSDDIEIQIVGRDDRGSPDLTRAAFHEAGHLVAALAHPNLTVSSASIASSGGSGGRVDFDRRTSLPSFADIEKDVVVVLAGRAAEKVFLGNASVGAGGEGNSDLAVATGTLASMYMSYGYMTDCPIWRCEPNHAISMLAVDQALREKVNQHLVRLSNEAEALVTQKETLVRAFAEELTRQRRLSKREINMIVAGHVSAAA